MEKGRPDLSARPALTGETATRCDYCGWAVDVGESVCPGCGRTARSKAMGRDSEGEIYLMLVTANVLRLRRQYALAQAKCSDVLERDPDNAAAYSVLGSIARDQGKLRDAIEWYKMALARNPRSAADRRATEELIDEVFSGGGKRVGRRAIEAVTRAVDSATEQVKAVRALSPMSLLLWAVLSVLIVITAFAVVLGRGTQGDRLLAGKDSPSGAFVPAPAEQVRAPLEPAAAPSAAPRFEDNVEAVEKELLQHLRERARALDPNCRVQSVAIDPRDGVLSLQLSMPRLWSRESARTSMRRISVALAAAAVGSEDRLSAVRVRCYMRQTGMADRVGMVAEGTAEDLAKAATGPEARAPGALRSVWWHPELRAEVEPTPAPGAE